MSNHPRCKFISLLFVALMAGCGGGGSDPSTTSSSTTTNPPTNSPTTPPGGAQPPGTSPTTPAPVPDSASMTMSCVDGPNYQCSGGSIIKSENGVALTSSGVQAYGKSTSDLADPNRDVTGAFGFALASGGVAEIRLAKDSSGTISQAALLLSNLGLTWDGKTERPQIVDTFNPTQGRVELDSRGALTFGVLPPSSDLNFYDFAVKGTAGTQQNYANNRYFPRSEPSRCDPPSSSCPTIETRGLFYYPGGWRTGGSTPDRADALRVHGDGDVHAGDALPGSNPPWLEGGTGYGVPFPGSKGYRAVDLWSFQYANLGAWVTQDTVQIGEWGAPLAEHNKNRRGTVAFGAVSDPAAVPATGSATYSGTAYGWYSRDAVEEPSFFSGPATVTVNFASREVVVTIANTVTPESGTSVPVALRAVTTMGAAGTSSANYMTGPVDNGTLRGGLSGRHFGPVVATGTSGQGPAEIGGALSLSNATTGAAAIGGFIARKQ
jgi:hypothetical protein